MAILTKIQPVTFEQVGHTVALAGVDARINQDIESTDYLALRRECETLILFF